MNQEVFESKLFEMFPDIRDSGVVSRTQIVDTMNALKTTKYPNWLMTNKVGRGLYAIAGGNTVRKVVEQEVVENDVKKPTYITEATVAAPIVDGNYVAVANSKYDFILKDKQNNQLYYTMTDFWDDIYDDLFDYLDVAQEEDADEDGRYMSTASDWKDYITGDDILSALPSYLNDNAKRGIAIDAVDTISRWEDGENKFLMLNPETIEAIESDEIKNKAKGLLGLN